MQYPAEQKQNKENRMEPKKTKKPSSHHIRGNFLSDDWLFPPKGRLRKIADMTGRPRSSWTVPAKKRAINSQSPAVNWMHDSRCVCKNRRESCSSEMNSAVRVNEIIFRSVYFQKQATQNGDTGCGLPRQVRRICVLFKTGKTRAAHQVCYVEPEVNLKHSTQVILRVDLRSHSSGVFLHKIPCRYLFLTGVRITEISQKNAYCFSNSLSFFFSFFNCWCRMSVVYTSCLAPLYEVWYFRIAESEEDNFRSDGGRRQKRTAQVLWTGESKCLFSDWPGHGAPSLWIRLHSDATKTVYFGVWYLLKFFKFQSTICGGSNSFVWTNLSVIHCKWRAVYLLYSLVPAYFSDCINSRIMSFIFQDVKVIKQYFAVVLFILLLSLVLTFESVNESRDILNGTEQYFPSMLFVMSLIGWFKLLTLWSV